MISTLKEGFKNDAFYRTLIDINIDYIQYIDTPSSDLCLFAIKKNPECIKYIKDQPIELYIKLSIEAVKLDGTLIRYINDPTLDIIITAVSNDFRAMKYININEEDEDLCTLLVMINPICIEYINDCWIRLKCKLLINKLLILP